MNDAVSELKVCLLAGGLSKRLRPLTDAIPKAMVPVGDKPFIRIQMEHFASLGFRRFVLAVCYLWEQIRDYFDDGERFGWEIEYSVEDEPLGTGGAVLWAHKMWANSALVANGDTFLSEDWRLLRQTHESAGTAATMALVHQGDCSRFGKVTLEGDRVVGFEEKAPGAGAGWINAGVYMLEEAALSSYSRGETFSLEKDVFPRLVGQIAAYRCKQAFADIGTPASLKEFRGRIETQPGEQSP